MAALLSICFILAPALGCQNDLEGFRGVDKPGIDPPRSKLFFPSALAISEDGRYLFVSNANAIVKYNGGTIAVVDLEEAARQIDFDFAGSCTPAPQDPSVLECEESDGLILGEAAVRVPNYPSQISMIPRLMAESPDEAGSYEHYRLFVTVRGQPALVYMDAVYESADPDAKLRCLTCGEGCSSADSKITDCNKAHIVTDPPKDAPFLDQSLPDEPYGVFAHQALGLAYVTHLSQNAISVFDLSDDETPRFHQVIWNTLSSDLNGRYGGFGVVALDPGDPDTLVYMTNRMAPEVVAFAVQGGAVRASHCSTGFCQGHVCSECALKEDCPGARECRWDPELRLFNCQGGELALGSSCTDDSQCSSGFCTEDRCSTCSSQQPCLGAATCQLDLTAGHHDCLAGDTDLGGSCESDDECTSGVCKQNVCSACRDDADCPGTTRCRRKPLGEGSWAYGCLGGEGKPGARCDSTIHLPADMEPMLAAQGRIVMSAPSGTAEELLVGDMRGISARPDGQQIYAISRVPPALAILDTSDDDGRPANRFMDLVEICTQPSMMRTRQLQNGSLFAYIACWGTGQVFVVDLNALDVIKVIYSGNGPHDLAIAPDLPWIPPKLRHRAYVTNFAENTISVIDLDPESPRYHMVIGKIGIPERAVDE